MDLQPNKTDAIIKPITNTRISASEWNQLVGSCMEFITQAGFTPDAADNSQLLNAFIQIAQNLGIVGANVDFSNVSATGKNTAIQWGSPDYSAGVSVPFPLIGAKYTVPYDGVYVALFKDNNNTTFLVVNGTETSVSINSSSVDRDAASLIIPLNKGDEIYWSRNYSSLIYSTFYPYKGAS